MAVAWRNGIESDALPPPSVAPLPRSKRKSSRERRAAEPGGMVGATRHAVVDEISSPLDRNTSQNVAGAVGWRARAEEATVGQRAQPEPDATPRSEGRMGRDEKKSVCVVEQLLREGSTQSELYLPRLCRN